MTSYAKLPKWVSLRLHSGLVIPAHPLALQKNCQLDERRQRALTRYYHAAGAGGIAVGVHTTQFEIRDKKHRLFRPVLELAASAVADCDRASGRQTILIGGICGRTRQAVSEATQMRGLGYHIGLLSLVSFRNESESEIIRHCHAIAQEMPIFGFYLQPAVGGRVLSHSFWCRFVEIPNVAGIKIAAFNRYRTLDVIRAVAESDKSGEIALYTGNDDNIVVDLVTKYQIQSGSKRVKLGMVGGLLGHWAYWTRPAVRILEICKRARADGNIAQEILTLAGRVTDCNAAVFDAAHGFSGCIPGIQEVLHRQGFLQSTRCLNPRQRLSPGQREEINRVCWSHPDLMDDNFVAKHLDRWLS